MILSTTKFVTQCKEARDLSRLLAENISTMTDSTLAQHQKAHTAYQQEIANTLNALQDMSLSSTEKEDIQMAQIFLKEILNNNHIAIKNAQNSKAIISSELNGVKNGRSALSSYGQFSGTSSSGRLMQRVG